MHQAWRTPELAIQGKYGELSGTMSVHGFMKDYAHRARVNRLVVET
ncbi:MAG: hypothetical protein Q9M27_06050 [Mariprofundaceae bacterium]|nr:hypothetical protein [Mariprofundaceae bacterium]